MIVINQLIALGEAARVYREERRYTYDRAKFARKLVEAYEPVFDLVDAPIGERARTVVAMLRGILDTANPAMAEHLRKALDEAYVELADSLIAEPVPVKSLAETLPEVEAAE